MKKRVLLMLIIMVLSIFFINVNLSYAEGEEEDRRHTIDETVNSARDFITSADTSNTFDNQAMKENTSLIYNIFFAVGMVAAVGVGVALGVQFMFSSTEGQAKVKEMLLPYVIGCFILFGAFGIWRIMVLVLEKIG